MTGSSGAGARRDTLLPRCASALAVIAFAGTLRAEPDGVVADGRDEFTLLQRRLMNRQLFEQLAEPDQSFRIGADWDRWALAVDTRVGSQQTLSDADQTRFHGFFVFDSFVAVRPFYGFDANLALALYNPSASDGYRVSSAVSPGGTLHFYHEHEFEGAGRARLDLWGTDLDSVTLGGGLLMEEWPNEGAYGSLAYEDVAFRYLFAGRAFWPTDDLIAYTFDAFDGKAELTFADWKFRETEHHSNFLSLSSRWPLLERSREELAARNPNGPARWPNGMLPKHRIGLVAELAAHLPDEEPATTVVVVSGERFDAPAPVSEQWRFGTLLRGDYIDAWRGVRWHVGYQFRWYQQAFGPREILELPTSNHNLPYRADSYVTNSFEYFASSLFQEQWSHTAMLEASVPLGRYFRAFGELELIDWSFEDPESPDRVLQDSLLAEPMWYRGGLELYPWPGLPHRLSGILSNKQVTSDISSQSPVMTRFTRGNFVTLQMELFL